MKNKYLYIILTVLLVLVVLFGTMILSLTNRVSNIEKSETTSLQLSQTADSNAYISTGEHLAELNNLSGNILWTNPNPTASFAEQTINIDFTGYTAYEIIYATDSYRRGGSHYALVPLGIRLMDFYTDQHGTYSYRRDFNFSTKQFSNCAQINPGGGDTPTTNENLVPVKIIGYK